MLRVQICDVERHLEDKSDGDLASIVQQHRQQIDRKMHVERNAVSSVSSDRSISGSPNAGDAQTWNLGLRTRSVDSADEGNPEKADREFGVHAQQLSKMHESEKPQLSPRSRRHSAPVNEQDDFGDTGAQADATDLVSGQHVQHTTADESSQEHNRNTSWADDTEDGQMSIAATRYMAVRRVTVNITSDVDSEQVFCSPTA